MERDTTHPETTEEGQRDLQRFVGQLLLRHSPCVEVRVIGKAGAVYTGYFNDADALADELEQIGAEGNVYATLQEVKPEVKERVQNEFRRGGRGTADSDIAAYRWLFLDFDPVRASGVSSTEEEKQHAFQVREQVRWYLDAQSWPAPVLADSGNGYHLLYWLNLPATEEHEALLKGVLTELSRQFSTEQVHLDTSVANPSRLIKLYGTIARKGEDTTERPHRRSSLVCPPKIKRVKKEQLEAIVRVKEPAKRPEKQPAFDVEEWLIRHHLSFSQGKQGEEWRLWTLEVCPFDQGHVQDKASYIMQFDSGAIYAGCHHDRCKEGGKNRWGELWKKYEGKDWKEGTEEQSGDVALLADLWGALYNDDWRYDLTTGRWAFWAGTHWERYEKPGFQTKLDQAAEQVCRLAGVAVSQTKVDGIRRFAASRCQWEGEARAGLVNFQNGTLDTATMQLREHRRADNLFYCIGYDYAPGEHFTPTIDAFLNRALPDLYGQQAFMAHIGLSLMGDTRLHFQLVVKGETRAGKSTLLDLALATCGERRGHYAGDSLFSTDLEGKRERFAYVSQRIVCVDELKAETWRNEEVIKRMFAHGGVEIRGIGRDTVRENQWCPKIIIATNEVPHYKDVSGAIQSRLVYIESGPALSKEERDSNLFGKLSQELGAFAHRCILLGKLAQERGHYPLSAGMQRALKEAASNGNVLRVFVEDEGLCVLEPGCEMASKDLYTAFKEYCLENGHTPISKTKFTQSLKEMYRVQVTTPRKVSPVYKDRFYLGIRRSQPNEKSGGCSYEAEKPLRPIVSVIKAVEDSGTWACGTKIQDEKDLRAS